MFLDLRYMAITCSQAPLLVTSKDGAVSQDVKLRVNNLAEPKPVGRRYNTLALIVCAPLEDGVMLHEHGHQRLPQVHSVTIALRPGVVVLNHCILDGELLYVVVELVYATTLAEALSEIVHSGIILEDVKGVSGHHLGSLRCGIGYDWCVRLLSVS